MAGRADAQALLRFEAFRRGESGERLFRHPTCHPSQPTGFCPCDGSPTQRHLFYLKAALLDATLKLPYDGPKIRLLRWLGATIGERVVIAAGTWIDPTFPDLLTIEDDVMIGVQAKIALHEFRAAEFLAGRTIIRKGAVIGGFAVLAPGIEVGEGAVVGGAAVVGRDVPAGKTAIGNPARIVRTTP